MEINPADLLERKQETHVPPELRSASSPSSSSKLARWCLQTGALSVTG